MSTTYRILFESEPFEASSPEAALDLLNKGGIRIANRRLEYQLPMVWVPASEQSPGEAAPKPAPEPAKVLPFTPRPGLHPSTRLVNEQKED